MKKFVIITLILIVVIAGFVFLKKGKTTETKTQFETMEVKYGNIEEKVLSTGIIQPYTRVTVRSPVRGRIEKVFVDERDKVKKGDLLALISSEDRVAILDAAQSILEEAKASGDKQKMKDAKESYEIAKRAYKPIPLITSISGTVIRRNCEPGQNVSLENELFVLSDRLIADVEVDEADIGKIQKGQYAEITLDAFPDEKLPAEVAKISAESKTVSDIVIYDVMVQPLTVPEKWMSGMTANVEFFISKKDNILIVPERAVKDIKGSKVVFVLENGKPVKREIETGISDGRVVEVKSGLKEGEEIILNMADFMKDKAQMRIIMGGRR